MRQLCDEVKRALKQMSDRKVTITDKSHRFHRCHPAAVAFLQISDLLFI